jgi:hypothetical protein
VGVLVDKGFEKLNQVFVPIIGEEDAFLIDYAQKLINSSKSQISILDTSGIVGKTPSLKEKIRAIEQNAPHHLTLINQKITPFLFLIEETFKLEY